MTTPPFSHPSEEDEYFFEEGCYILELANRADDPAVSVARARACVAELRIQARDIVGHYFVPFLLLFSLIGLVVALFPM